MLAAPDREAALADLHPEVREAVLLLIDGSVVNEAPHPAAPTSPAA